MGLDFSCYVVLLLLPLDFCCPVQRGLWTSLYKAEHQIPLLKSLAFPFLTHLPGITFIALIYKWDAILAWKVQGDRWLGDHQLFFILSPEWINVSELKDSLCFSLRGKMKWSCVVTHLVMDKHQRSMCVLLWKRSSVTLELYLEDDKKFLDWEELLRESLAVILGIIADNSRYVISGVLGCEHN